MSQAPAHARPNFLDQPKAVWATAFACVVGFMSIGLVDPILTSIAKGLDATPGQVSLLFSSYFFVTSVMMLITGFVSSRLGGGRTVLLGAALIVVFSALSGRSNSVAELVALRAGWGLGNAFFVVTALSVIVATSRGGIGAAILMYEAALGLGISTGPLLGAALGGISWRYPFYGTAVLMAIGFLAIWLFLPPQPKPAQKISISAPIRALGHGGLLTAAIAAFFYNFAFFTVLAFVPFVLNMSAHAVGLIFFGWGLLLAIFSVLVAPRLQSRFSTVQILTGCLLIFALLLLIMAHGSLSLVAGCVVVSGSLMGVCNTVFTELALSVSDSPRPVASAGYNFLRWFAGVVAPIAAPRVAEAFGVPMTFYIATLAALASGAVLVLRRRTLAGPRHDEPATEAPGIVAAIDGGPEDALILDRAAELAGSGGGPVRVLHVRPIEVVNDDAAATETRPQSQALLDAALKSLADRNIPASGEVIDASAAHVTDTLRTAIARLAPRYVVLGRAHGGWLDRAQHGSTAEALVRDAPAGPELVVV